MLERARARSARWLPPALESPAVSGVTADGVPVAAGGGDQAAGALGVGVDRPGPVSVVLGTSGVVFAALERLRRRSAGARARVLPRRAGRLARDGRDALGGRLAALAARHGRRRRRLRRADRARPPAWPPGDRGPDCSSPTSSASARPHADPDARGAFAGLSVRHDRGALVRAVLEGVAFGLRDSLDLIAELGGRAGVRARLGRRRAQRAVAADRRLGARAAARARRRRRGRGVRRGDPRRRRGRRLARRRTRRSRRRSARGERIEPVPEWVEVYRPGASASARCTRRSRASDRLRG